MTIERPEFEARDQLFFSTQSMPTKPTRKRGRGDGPVPPALPGPAPGRDRTPADRPVGARPAPGSGSAAGSGGAVGRRGAEQVDVRRMISRLNRDDSPAKRQRPLSVSGGSSASAEDDEPCADEQMAAFQRMLQQELKKQTSLLTAQFQKTTDSLKEELLAMQQKVGDLETHVNEQGETIQHLYDAVDKRDRRIRGLEGEMEEMRRENNCPYLTFDGPGVPAAPREEPWKEDVAATTRTLLHKFMPQTEVREADIVQCYRVNKGKKIVCQFARCGQASVRDEIYDSRMALMKDENGQMRDSSEQLFVNEKLTTGAFAAFLKLREEKRRGRIHSVYTKYGVIYVRMRQHGAKIRVHNGETCDRVLRGEC